MAKWLETNRGLVLPQFCDHYGHMNVRFYAHFFDDAGFHLWSQLGILQGDLAKRNLGQVVASTSTNFIHETRAGELVIVESAFTEIGDKSVTYQQRLHNAERDQLHAKQTVVEVFFDTAQRKSASMPDDVREIIQANIVKP